MDGSAHARREGGVDAMLSRLFEVREQTVRLCAPLEIEDYVVQPAAEVSPPKWHLAHTSWFFEQFLLQPRLSGYRLFDPLYRRLFNSYYKSAGAHWLQGERGTLSRPTVREILDYRRYVDDGLERLMRLQAGDTHGHWLIELGIQHEQQHQELLWMDIKRILAANPSMPGYGDAPPLPQAGLPGWAVIDPGLYVIGAGTHGFSWDNERPAHRAWIEAAAVETQLVTNASFREFVDDGGYDDASLWLSKGWDWVRAEGISAPLYWNRIDGEWREYTFTGERPLDADAPVMHVSYYEADAYARWRGCRLPEEQELEVFQQRRADPPSLWCWTRSPYRPYPGFRPFEGAFAEYNGKFMCGQYVLKGGCFLTSAGHLRNSYRNFFEPHQRWMFSGIRLARD